MRPRARSLTRAPGREFGQGGQHPVDIGKTVDRGQAFASRHGVGRCIEVDIESASGAAKMDQHAADRERGHELSSLQRLRRVRQRDEALIYAVFPIVRRPMGSALREAA